MIFERENTIMSKKDFNSGKVVSKYLDDEQVVKRFKKIAQADSSVLLTGETGVDKELIAWMIFANSKRCHNKFVTFNCCNVSDNLLESLLFGHKKGSVTSADRDHVGYFEEANGGTIFLDELCETSVEFQAKLLRFLETKVIRRLGDEKDIKVDVRIIAACNRNVFTAVKKGAFREDLYYRLNTFQIYIPALRDRVEDIELLANYFTDIYASQYDKNLLGITSDTLKILLNHEWKGNVRELRNTMEYAVIMTDTEHIDTDDLPPTINPSKSPFAIFLPENQENDDCSANPQLAKIQDYFNLDFAQSKDLFERMYLENLLEMTKGNISEMAKKSKLNRKFIYRKLEQFGISIEDFRKKK